MTPTAAKSSTSDLIRALALLASVVIAIVVGAWGAGAWGATPVEEVAGGALSDDATLLSPASTAFSIWSVIYTGLVAFAVFALLPARRGDERLRASTWLAAGASLLSAAWIGLVQAEALWAADIVIVGMVALLAMAARRLALNPPKDWAERLLADLPVGLFLGWSCVALVTGTTATLAASIDGHQPGDGTALAVVILLAVAVLAVLLPRWLRGSAAAGIGAGLALAWGLWGIAQARLTDEPHSNPVGWAAGIAAAVAFAAPFAVRDLSMIGKKDPLAPR